MGEQVNQNIAMLRSTFGSGRLFAPAEGDVFELDGIEFVCDYAPGSTADRFFIVKHAEHVRQYRELCGRFRYGNIVELGIAEGGGTVLTALVAEPTRLVAIDVETTPLAALAEFIAARGLEDVVRPSRRSRCRSTGCWSSEVPPSSTGTRSGWLIGSTTTSATCADERGGERLDAGAGLADRHDRPPSTPDDAERRLHQSLLWEPSLTGGE
jgi:hypothetical protein